MPERIVLSRARGFRLPPNTMVVSRPKPLSNPFRVYEHCKGKNGDWGVENLGRLHEPMGHGWTRAGAHQFAVDRYRELVDEVYPAGGTARWVLALTIVEHDFIACWCPLDLPCHTDVLKEIGEEALR
ncbi:MAG: DUF4326 domain-containing protein [Pseudolysinimonas sp.]